MPVITVAARALSLEKKRELVDKVTALICETYGVPPQSVTVFIEEHSAENIGVAGVLIADRK